MDDTQQKRAQLMQLAKRIQSARKQAKLSQMQLGTAIGLSDKSVSAYEKGRAVPPLDKLKQIANMTSRPLQYFTEEDTSVMIIEKKLELVERELREIKEILKRSPQK